MRNLSLSAARFAALAAGEGDFDGPLSAGLRSKRLILLHVVVEETIARQPAAARVIGHSRELISRAQRRDQAAADEVLLYPAVGNWAMRFLRLLHQPAIDTERLLDEAGYLTGVAAVAALRAGIDAQVRLRVCGDGLLCLPTLGVYQPGVPPGWLPVDVAGGDHTVTLRAGGGAVLPPPDGTHDRRWNPVKRLRSTVEGLRIDVAFDDVDPHRGLADLPVSAPQDGAALARWQERLDAAWELMVAHHRNRAAAIAGGVRAVVPLLATEAAPERSASSSECIGAIGLTEPADGTALAAALVHEFQHQKLSGLLSLLPLIDSDREQTFYAAWRTDPRPARGLLQGAYAYLALCDFWRVERSQSGDEFGALGHFEFALWRIGVGRALDDLQEHARLTVDGTAFLAGMRRKLDELDAEPVPTEVLALAEAAAAHQWITWRLRNLRPSPESIRGWGLDWLAGAAEPARGGVRLQVTVGPPEATQTGLFKRLRQRTLHPEARVHDDSGALTDIERADLAYVEGYYSRAGELYRQVIRAAPGHLDAWVGLALVARAQPRADTTALRDTPEQVRALYLAVSVNDAVDPTKIAAWLSRRSVRPEAAR